MLCSYQWYVTGQPIAHLHWEDNSWKLVCVCVDLEARNVFLSSVPYTVPQIIFWLGQKASHVRNQPNKGVDVSTVLSSKSYWHFQLTVFPLMYLVIQSPATHQVPEAGPGHFWSHSTKPGSICSYCQTEFKLLLLWDKEYRQDFMPAF